MSTDQLWRKLVSSKFQAWGTPRDFFAWVHAGFGFTRDVCAEKWNAKLSRFYSPEMNGLGQEWFLDVNWCNPEYKHVAEWISKSPPTAHEGGTVVNLVATRPETDWFRHNTESSDTLGRLRRSFYCPASRVLWLLGSKMTVGIHHHHKRLWFDHPEKKALQAIFPSTVLIFEPPVGYPKRRPAPDRPSVKSLAPEYRTLPLLTLRRP